MKTSQSKSPRLFHIPVGRRRFLRSMALASAGFTLSGYLAEALTATPGFTQGPYYPLADDIPLDKDNDLVRLDDRLTLVAGEITTLTGRVLNTAGEPVRGALVELWHADREGDYAYSTGVGPNPSHDSNFAGFGQFLTGSSGAFKFRTIKAGLYPGRTRHGQLRRVTTQTGWNEETRDLQGQRWQTQNSNDGVFRSVSSTQLASVLLNFTPVANGLTGETQGSWDYVTGVTPVEPNYPAAGGLSLAGRRVRVAGQSADRYEITLQTYPGYTYEVYGNPTFADLGWRVLPFSLSAETAPDRNKYTATTEGVVKLYLRDAAERGFYRVSFRVPGANAGTP
ncbi:MAG: hypothetical protein FJ405_00320 [Verrucomicrobia bacterium]|nr:hypothetical protein [Verrucomicrobiota bacterium]